MQVKEFFYSWQIPISLVLLLVVYIVDHFVSANHGVTDLFGPVRKEVYATIATIFGALFGFVITAFSIVVSLGESRLIAKLKEMGEYNRVTRAFMTTIYIVGVSTLVAVLAIFMDAKDGSPSRGWEYLVMLTAVAGGLSVLGIIFVLETLIAAQ